MTKITTEYVQNNQVLFGGDQPLNRMLRISELMCLCETQSEYDELVEQWKSAVSSVDIYVRVLSPYFKDGRPNSFRVEIGEVTKDANNVDEKTGWVTIGQHSLIEVNKSFGLWGSKTWAPATINWSACGAKPQAFAIKFQSMLRTALFIASQADSTFGSDEE